ncbi:DUF4136 domain-containing protein [Urechidicola vernalis]|uniref:DUF4136 domain-containing protein n=1 Tax=Urechidicola vernalis TaxID=3075600 RepID=A0ABU2Y448_9FLAO|nr:DUF4136 domain-containing protein [Urechidicola sp. P050]MDT0552822.1 DUF4136 domain-containing protein [Urechidicola sp. P050]
MRFVKLLSFLFVMAILFSCSPIRVAADYDTMADFTQYKSYAFYKKGIDKVEISDIDKKRILRAIETEFSARGMVKSDDPDLVVSIFAKSTKKVDIYGGYNNFYPYGYGYWSPWYYGPNYGQQVSVHEEGTLFVDFIDNKKKELVWQGIGKGALIIDNAVKKEARIKEFIKRILEKYPPFMEEDKKSKK